ncbi:MAG: ECF transporter S component [Ruminococcaceae bacterium]|nr:ECF transporter S component [Oscillospiraceae bacterium]
MKQKWNVSKIVFMAMLAALVCVVTLYRFPLLGSKVHLANAVCLLSGLLMGPVAGGLAAGLGSALYDALLGGYGVVECLVTFVSKFAMAWVCAKIAFAADEEAGKPVWNVVASVVGALTYVALYMCKTFVFQKFVYGYPMETVWLTMGSKLPASLINALAAMVAAPVLYTALRAALNRNGLLKKLRG